MDKEPIIGIRIVAICGMMLFLMCCVSISPFKFNKDRDNAINATNDFHNLFNHHRFEEIYGLTDKRARETKSKDSLISILSFLRDERGRVLNSELIDTDIQTRPTYRELHLSFRTKYENTEKIERFVWYVSDNQARLFSFVSE